MKKPEGIDVVRALLREEFPEFEESSITLVESGWDNLVAVVDDEVVFRFPRDRDGVPSMRRELLLLPELADIPFEVPEYRYVSSGDPFFAGYRMIPGKPLSSAGSLSDSLLGDMVRLLNYLRSVDFSIIDGTGLTIYDPDSWQSRQKDLLNNFRSKLSGMLGEEIFSEMSGRLENALSEIPETSMSLVHGDLYRGNVIISEDCMNIRGVIDWQDAFLGDKAMDAAALTLDFGSDSAGRLVRALGIPNDESFLQRMKFYQDMEPFYLAEHLSETGKIEEAEKMCRTIERILLEK